MIVDADAEALADMEAIETPLKRRRGEFDCNLCNIGFSTKRALLRHCRENKLHLVMLGIETPDSFICTECGKPCTRAYDLRRHQDEVHAHKRRRYNTRGDAIPDHGSGAIELPTLGSAHFMDSLQHENHEIHEELPPYQGPNEEPAVPILHSISDTRNDSVLKTIFEDATSEIKAAAWLYSDDKIGEDYIDCSAEKTEDHSHQDTDDWLATAFHHLYLNDSNEDKVLHGASTGPLSTKVKMCPFCKVCFTSGARLRDHFAVHIGNPLRVHICKDCDIGFSRKSDLSKHLQSVSLRKECGFRFNHRDTCSGHHPVLSPADLEDGDHARMDLYYLMQLGMNCDKTAEALDRQAGQGAINQRWSLNVVTRVRRSVSMSSSMHTWNTWWSAPGAMRSFRGKAASLIHRTAVSGNPRGSYAQPSTVLMQLRLNQDLHEAVGVGNLHGVQRAIANGANVNSIPVGQCDQIHEPSSTLLTQALTKGYFPVADALVASGAEYDKSDVQDAFKRLSLDIFKGASCGSLSIVRIAASTGIGLDATDGTYAALHYAAELGHIEILRFLIDQGANCDPKSLYGTTPLHVACSSGRLLAAEILLSSGANSQAIDYLDNTPLMYAARGNHIEIVNVLLENKFKDKLKSQSHKDVAARYAGRALVNALTTLCDNGANLYQPDAGFAGAAREAVEQHSKRISDSDGRIQGLLRLCEGRRTEEFNRIQPNISALFAFAASRGWVAMIKHLFEQEHLRRPEYSYGALRAACSFGHADLVSMMLDIQAELSHASHSSCDFGTLVISAAKRGHVNVVRLLVEKLEPTDERQRVLNKALLEATSTQMIDSVRLLLSIGADVGHAAPFDRVCTGDAADLVDLLLKNGIDFDAQMLPEESALSFAASNGYANTVNVLLEHGKDPNTFDIVHELPLLAAVRGFEPSMASSYIEIVAALKKHGAGLDRSVPGRDELANIISTIGPGMATHAVSAAQMKAFDLAKFVIADQRSRLRPMLHG